MKMDTIYHIVQKTDWVRALAGGVYKVDSLDSQGFIHMSKEEQVNSVANSAFKGEEDLLLLCIDYEKIKDRVSWEGEEDYGENFPHLYGPSHLDAVVKIVAFKPDQNDIFTDPIT